MSTAYDRLLAKKPAQAGIEPEPQAQPAPIEQIEPPEPLTPLEPPEPKKRGRRANGKSSNGDYERFGVIITRETHIGVQRVLLDLYARGEPKLDFSDAVEDALKFWLEHGPYRKK